MMPNYTRQLASQLTEELVGGCDAVDVALPVDSALEAIVADTGTCARFICHTKLNYKTRPDGQTVEHLR